jgi:tetratricopeptide (TPR) repeat protein
MNSLLRRLTPALLPALLLVGFSGVSVRAQETDDQAKIDIYKKFVDNRVQNPTVAYQAARDYLQRYPKDKDQYTDYLQKWMALYERDDRKNQLPGLISQKNFNEAFKVGQRILTDEPDYLRAQIDLGYAGYLAASNKDESHNAEALTYAKKAIAAIESGKAPHDWAPFKGKEDTLAYLNRSVGYLTLKTSPEQAIEPLLNAARLDSDLKKNPSTYLLLATAYESGPYKTLSTAYQTNFANKPETPESKAALEKLNVLMDRIIDSYARAIAASGNDPATAQNRKEWMVPLTNYYKFRHDGSDAGLTEFIAAALQKPLPPKP